MLLLSWLRENCLVKSFCLLCVCFQHQRVINSNNLGAQSRILHSVQEGGPSPSLGRHALLPDCSSTGVQPRMTIFWICKWTQTAEFLDNMSKRALKTGTAAITYVLCINQDKNGQGGNQVMSWWLGYWRLCDVWMRHVRWHAGKAESWSAVLRWPLTV
jgi:hypothetical protein